MYKIELPPTITKISTFFQFIGFWPSDKRPACLKSSFKFFFAFCYALFTINVVLFAVLVDEVNDSIFMVQMAIIFGIICLKSFYLLQKHDILTLLYDPIVTHSIEDRQEYVLFSNKVQQLMTFVHVYLIALLLTQGFHVSYSIFQAIMSDVKVLPLFMTFTWHDSNILYWCTFVLTTVSIFFTVPVSLFTIFLWYIMFNYSIEYEILGGKMRKLGRGMSRKQESFVDDLIALVKAQRKLIR